MWFSCTVNAAHVEASVGIFVAGTTEALVCRASASTTQLCRFSFRERCPQPTLPKRKSRVQGLGLRFRDVVSASIYGGVKIQGLRRRNRLRLGLPHARALPPGWQDFSQGIGICHPWGLHEVGYIFVVPPKGHPIYTLTKFKKEPYIHSPKQKYKPCFT